MKSLLGPEGLAIMGVVSWMACGAASVAVVVVVVVDILEEAHLAGDCLTVSSGCCDLVDEVCSSLSALSRVIYVAEHC